MEVSPCRSVVDLSAGGNAKKQFDGIYRVCRVDSGEENVGSGFWDRQAPRLSLYDRFVINPIHAQPIARAVILPLIRHRLRICWLDPDRGRLGERNPIPGTCSNQLHPMTNFLRGSTRLLGRAMWVLAFVTLCFVTVWAAAAISFDFPVTNLSLPAAILYLISVVAVLCFFSVRCGSCRVCLASFCSRC